MNSPWDSVLHTKLREPARPTTRVACNTPVIPVSSDFGPDLDRISEVVRGAVAAERERCAIIAEGYLDYHDENFASEIAAKIRSGL